MFSAAKSAGPSGYNLTNSLRFRASASAYLNRTPASASNRKTWTWSAWVKRGQLGAFQTLFCAGPSDAVSPFETRLRFNDTDTLVLTINGNGASGGSATTTAVFRDPSAWYHIVAYVDMAASGQANKVRLYVNGVLQAVTYTILTTTDDTQVNNNVIHRINANSFALSGFADCYLDEINFIDGQALTPSSFGSFNATTGVWQPARYTGTYGTNGFYLNFTDIGLTSGSNTGLGRDFSGNGNFWNTNNISVTAGATYDAMSDVPTLTSATVANYAVLNLLSKSSGSNISGGNLNWSSSVYNFQGATSTIALPTSDKWYWETIITTAGTAVTDDFGVGVQALSFGTTPQNNNAITDGAIIISRRDFNSRLVVNNSILQSGTSYSFATNDIVQVAFDASTGKIWFGKNNSWFDASGGTTGNPASGTNQVGTLTAGGSYLPVWNGYTNTYVVSINMGQRPFAYTPPTGFNRLNTFNLPTSTIVKGNTVMDATLYTGNGTTNGQTQNITGLAFDPDLIWVKSRSSGVEWHGLNDTVRGAGNVLSSNATNAEFTGGISSITNGFQVTFYSGGNVVSQNTNNNTYVGWTWDAGSSTVTNTSGSISSQVRANTTAGFSIVTYTGNATNGATVGHGLGVAPRMIIGKIRSTTGDWYVWQTTMGDNFMRLNTTAAQVASTANGVYNTASFSSTVFALGSGSTMNASGGTYVAYCWAEIAGFSRFGSYTGNGSADGPFIYTGFRPEWIMIKSSTEVTDWHIMDASRLGYNANNSVFYPNNANAEQGYLPLDILSNGFKLRATSAGGNINASGQTYIYATFAQNPFKNALAR